jgi:hypothetical protein
VPQSGQAVCFCIEQFPGGDAGLTTRWLFDNESS